MPSKHLYSSKNKYHLNKINVPRTLSPQSKQEHFLLKRKDSYDHFLARYHKLTYANLLSKSGNLFLTIDFTSERRKMGLIHIFFAPTSAFFFHSSSKINVMTASEVKKHIDVCLTVEFVDLFILYSSYLLIIRDLKK